MALKPSLTSLFNHIRLLLMFALLVAVELLPVQADSSPTITGQNGVDMKQQCLEECTKKGRVVETCSLECHARQIETDERQTQRVAVSSDGSVVSHRKARAAAAGGSATSGAKKPAATFVRVGKAAARGSFVRIGRQKPSDVEQIADDAETDSNCIETDDVICLNDVTKRRSNNNFVRIGRQSVSDLDDSEIDPLEKRAKQAFVRIGRKASANFVRIGRPGFVRIGKSVPDASSAESALDRDDGLLAAEN